MPFGGASDRSAFSALGSAEPPCSSSTASGPTLPLRWLLCPASRSCGDSLAADGYSANTLRGGFVKSVFLADVDGSSRTGRHSAVRELFTTAGFSISHVADFRSWLWFHFILDAAIMVGWLRMGNFDAPDRSQHALREAVRLVREMIPVLKAKGGTSGLGAATAAHTSARVPRIRLPTPSSAGGS